MKKRELQRRYTDRRNFDDRRDGNAPVEKDKRSESGRRKIDDRRSGRRSKRSLNHKIIQLLFI